MSQWVRRQLTTSGSSVLQLSTHSCTESNLPTQLASMQPQYSSHAEYTGTAAHSLKQLSTHGGTKESPAVSGPKHPTSSALH
jgi:hypothetical protein